MDRCCQSVAAVVAIAGINCGGSPVDAMSPVGDPPEPLHTIHERLYQAAVNGEAHKIVELIKLGAKMVPDQVSENLQYIERTPKS